MQRSRRIAVLATACAIAAVASATAFTVAATAASAANPSCTVPPASSPTPTPAPSGTQFTCEITDTDVDQPANLSVTVKLARTDNNNDIVDWEVAWDSQCYNSSGASLGYDSGRQAGNIGPASEGTELVQVGTANNAYTCTVHVYLNAVLTSSEGMSMELQYTSLAPSSSPSATPSPSASRPGVIKGYDGKCVDDAKNSRNKGAKAVIWSCSTKDHAEQWTLVGGQLRLNGLCLSSRGDAANGTAVILYTCNQSQGEIWEHLKNGSVANKEQDGALCLTDPNYAKKNGTQLILATCRNTSDQHWSMP
jgi:hypothetical protein